MILASFLSSVSHYSGSLNPMGGPGGPQTQSLGNEEGICNYGVGGFQSSNAPQKGGGVEGEEATELLHLPRICIAAVWGRIREV